ncbi:MAG: DUF6918 family protein [Sciscionella sp.]
MAETLQEILLTNDNRQLVVTDCEKLIDDEVAGKSGVSGLAVKGGFGVVKKIKPGMIHDAVDSLLDDFVARLQPFYAEHLAAGGGSLPAHLTGRSGEVADALLGITDERAERSQRPTIKKAYEKLRPKGKENVEEALPRLGELLAKYTG